MSLRCIKESAIKNQSNALVFLEDKGLKRVFNWLDWGWLLQVRLEQALASARLQPQVRPEWQGLPSELLLVQLPKLPGSHLFLCHSPVLQLRNPSWVLHSGLFRLQVQSDLLLAVR